MIYSKLKGTRRIVKSKGFSISVAEDSKVARCLRNPVFHLGDDAEMSAVVIRLDFISDSDFF